jgi:hypothetical protein
METDTQIGSGTEDSSLLTIDINDIDRKTILYLLEYVYTGGIKKLASPGAAISHTLVIDNMKSEMLKQTTCDYIANNLGNVMETTVNIFFMIIIFQ